MNFFELEQNANPDDQHVNVKKRIADYILKSKEPGRMSTFATRAS